MKNIYLTTTDSNEKFSQKKKRKEKKNSKNKHKKCNKYNHIYIILIYTNTCF